MRGPVAVAGEEEVAAERPVGDDARRQPVVDLIDVFLPQRAKRLWSQRKTLSVGQRELGAQARRVGAERGEPDRRRRGTERLLRGRSRDVVPARGAALGVIG